jgi:hypothetical protein
VQTGLTRRREDAKIFHSADGLRRRDDLVESDSGNGERIQRDEFPKSSPVPSSTSAPVSRWQRLNANPVRNAILKSLRSDDEDVLDDSIAKLAKLREPENRLSLAPFGWILHFRVHSRSFAV